MRKFNVRWWIEDRMAEYNTATEPECIMPSDPRWSTPCMEIYRWGSIVYIEPGVSHVSSAVTGGLKIAWPGIAAYVRD